METPAICPAPVHLHQNQTVVVHTDTATELHKKERSLMIDDPDPAWNVYMIITHNRGYIGWNERDLLSSFFFERELNTIDFVRHVAVELLLVDLLHAAS